MDRALLRGVLVYQGGIPPCCVRLVIPEKEIFTRVLFAIFLSNQAAVSATYYTCVKCAIR